MLSLLLEAFLGYRKPQTVLKCLVIEMHCVQERPCRHQSALDDLETPFTRNFKAHSTTNYLSFLVFRRSQLRGQRNVPGPARPSPVPYTRPNL